MASYALGATAAFIFFFFQAEDGIRDTSVTGVQTCALPICGGTGMIGDPSGQQSERPLLSKDQIRDNVHHQRDQVARLLDFDTKDTRALVLNNADWLVEQRLVDFLREDRKSVV